MADLPAALEAAALRDSRGVDLTVWPPRYDPAYRPAPAVEHWLPEIECADPAERDALIFAKLVRQVRYAWERSPFYRRKWQEAGVSPDTLKSLDDLARFPVVQKADLRQAQAAAPPFGDYLCIEPTEVARIHGTSGTTGRATVFGIGAEDWARIGEAHARILWGAGIRPGDRILICSFFSLYLGSWGALAGGERLGGTPSTQVCDPETFRPLPYGAEGTPVYTHLERTSQPMIRLVSGDRARWVDEPCPCGRTYPRLPRGLDGRFDDMIIVRGENVYPGAIEDTLRAIDGFGGEFRVIVSRREAMDEKARRVIDDRDLYRQSLQATR